MAVLKFAILFGLLSSTAFATPTKRSLCQPGRQIINGVQYTISCGLDRAGGDYDRAQTSFGACISACAADSTCVTAQYHEDNGYCYFKNTVNAPTAIVGEDTVDLGSACHQSTTLTINALQCSLQCGIDSHGGDYISIRTGNYLACAQECAADGNCVTAQYNEGNGYCYLKNANNGQVSSTDTDTIVCDRPVV